MLRIIVFAEAEADARLGCGLGDRVLVEEGPDWIADLPLEHLRRCTGIDDRPGFTKWTRLLQESNGRRGPRYLRRPTGGPKGSDYAMAVKALLFVKQHLDTGSDPLAVMMLRDCDASRDKREGLREASKEQRFSGLNVIVGIADRMREAWVLNGFTAGNREERDALSDLAAELGFDPAKEAHRLRATKESEPRHPKRVLARLTGGSRDREVPCWQETTLAELRSRGGATGLAAFLDALHERLLPLVAGTPSPQARG